MTRAQGRASRHWVAQVVHITEPPVNSAAHLVLLTKHYFSQDKTIYVEYKMSRIRKRWMKEQLLHPDEAGGLTCAICGKQGLQPFGNPPDDKTNMATLDHIIPIFAGGSWNDPTNFQVACYSCNNNRHDSHYLRLRLTEVCPVDNV